MKTFALTLFMLGLPSIALADGGHQDVVSTFEPLKLG